MGESVYEGLTVGYCLALTQFVMVGVLGLMYLRRSEKVYDPLAERVRQRALDPARERPGEDSLAANLTRERSEAAR